MDKKKIFYMNFAVFLLFITIPLISVGYSALQTTLNISGDFIMYSRPTLYNVLAKAAQVGTYAKEYVGIHQDSMTGVGSQKIYHWYATSSSSAISEMSNVIFAGQCWNMYRTTDTGGVRLAYNGEAVDGKCLSGRSSHIGYDSFTGQSTSSSYWYGSDFVYDSSTKKFSLTGSTLKLAFNSSTFDTLKGMYSCRSTNKTATCSKLYYVFDYKNVPQFYILTGTASYHGYGTIPYNYGSDYVGAVGYKFNKNVTNLSISGLQKTLYVSKTISSTDQYGEGISYSNGSYTLVNSGTAGSYGDNQNLVGKYTVMSPYVNGTGTVAYYVTKVSGSTFYAIELSEGNLLNNYNDVYTYSTSYIDNGNGTYSLNNPTTINTSDYYKPEYYSYICINATNNICNELLYVLYSDAYSFNYLSSNNKYKFGNGFNFNNGVYELTGSKSTIWNYVADNDNIVNTHYTCFSLSDTCETLYYAFLSRGGSLYYFTLNNGDGIEEIKNEVFFSGANVVDSTVKTGIDMWYERYLAQYDSYIEDSIYCNDRTITDLGGLNPNGGLYNSTIKFHEYSENLDLRCTNVSDRFSINNEIAQLSHKAGLLTWSEVNLLNNTGIEMGGWTMTPAVTEATTSRVYLKGTSATPMVSTSSTIRPIISLKPEIEYSDGDGSKANPYIISVTPVTGNLAKQSNNNSVTFDKNISRNSFESITTLANTVIPSNAIDSWDASEQKNGTVMAWYTDDDNNGLYELYLGQVGGVKANKNSSYAFWKFENASTINLRNYKTTGVTNMHSMFENAGYNATTFTVLGLSLFDTSQVTDMAYMFCNSGNNSTKWEIGDISGWDVSRVQSTNRMFGYAAYSSSKFNVGNLLNWDTSSVTSMSYMFFHAGQSASNWYIGGLNVYGGNTGYMFNQCPNSNGTINIYNSPSNYGYMFASAAIASGKTITVNYSSVVTDIDDIIATKAASSNVVKGSLLN